MNSDPSDPAFSSDLSNLQSIVSGGEANVMQTAKKNVCRLLMRLWGRRQVIRIGYGLTESSAALTYGMLVSEYEAKEKHEFAFIGRPISGAKMRISRDDGTPANAYETGNLEISGPVVFKRYYNDPANAFWLLLECSPDCQKAAGCAREERCLNLHLSC